MDNHFWEVTIIPWVSGIAALLTLGVTIFLAKITRQLMLLTKELNTKTALSLETTNNQLAITQEAKNVIWELVFSIDGIATRQFQVRNVGTTTAYDTKLMYNPETSLEKIIAELGDINPDEVRQGWSSSPLWEIEELSVNGLLGNIHSIVLVWKSKLGATGVARFKDLELEFLLHHPDDLGKEIRLKELSFEE